MNKENCALKLVDEIILYYDARSKKVKLPDKVSLINYYFFVCERNTAVHPCINSAF